MIFRLLLFFTFLSFCPNLFSQHSEGGVPPGLMPENEAIISQKKFERAFVPAPDLQKLRSEDEAEMFQYRFAAPVAVDFSIEKSGSWIDLPSGQRLWRCEIHAPGAKGLVLMFDRFQIPAGGRFFAYNGEKRAVLGAFTEKSCQPNGKFLLGPLPGETTVLEYLEPASARDQAVFSLYRVDYAYNESAWAEVAGLLDFGDALNCHTNINCQLASNWYRHKKGVARILMVFSNATGFCTGSMIANTAGTTEPYFLTAHHCQIIGQNPDFSMWRFDFNYEHPDCPSLPTEPTYQSILGCERLAYRAETDFMLLKIKPVPYSYGIYFNGWSRDESNLINGTFIHHPKGDTKKYSASVSPTTVFPQSISWGGQFGMSQPNTHYKSVPDVGTFQPGSSGCPLFDEVRRIVGQLHGGTTATNDPCRATATYFGMFNLSWNAGSSPTTRLKDWLDSAGTNAMTQDGYYQPPPPPPPTYSIEGNVKTHWGANMKNVKVTAVVGPNLVQTVLTDSLGNFKFTSLDQNMTYEIRPDRDTNDLNGVSTFDLLNISKHILDIQKFTTPFQMISADANNSNTITSFDILEFRKAILGIYPDGVPGLASWKFIPASSNLATPASAFPVPQGIISVPSLSANVSGVNFIGIKMGDNNGNADPKN